MAEPNNEHPEQEHTGDQTPQDMTADDSDVPVEEAEVQEPERPRRAASAEFVVQAQAGSASVLREAMDPANQSLADALRLSYRVLQIVIVILILLFLVSGFRRIESSETGVQTLFGEIQGGEGVEAELQPGLAMSWLPYPAAEFIVFNQNHAIDLLEAFWPNQQIGDKTTYEKAAESGTVYPTTAFAPGLGPNRDGMVLLADGLGHVQLRASYRIEDPVDFVKRIKSEEHGRRLVKLALQRATIHVTSKMTLDAIIDEAEVVADRVQTAAQELLDELDGGIALQRVQALNLRPPIAIASSVDQLGAARSAAEASQSAARTERSRLLVEAAGEGYRELLDLIGQYEEVILESGTNSPEARSLLQQIDLKLESDEVGGQVSQILAEAGAYKEGIVSTLGAYADRFQSLYPQYQANPQFVVRRELFDTYQRVMSGELVEVIHLPKNLERGIIQGTTSNELMVKKRRVSQQQRREEAIRATGLGRWRHRLGEHNIRHRLEVDEEGRVRGRNTNQ